MLPDLEVDRTLNKKRITASLHAIFKNLTKVAVRVRSSET